MPALRRRCSLAPSRMRFPTRPLQPFRPYASIHHHASRANEARAVRRQQHPPVVPHAASLTHVCACRHAPFCWAPMLLDDPGMWPAASQHMHSQPHSHAQLDGTNTSVSSRDSTPHPCPLSLPAPRSMAPVNGLPQPPHRWTAHRAPCSASASKHAPAAEPYWGAASGLALHVGVRLSHAAHCSPRGLAAYQPRAAASRLPVPQACGLPTLSPGHLGRGLRAALLPHLLLELLCRAHRQRTGSMEVVLACPTEDRNRVKAAAAAAPSIPARALVKQA